MGFRANMTQFDIDQMERDREQRILDQIGQNVVNAYKTKQQQKQAEEKIALAQKAQNDRLKLELAKSGIDPSLLDQQEQRPSLMGKLSGGGEAMSIPPRARMEEREAMLQQPPQAMEQGVAPQPVQEPQAIDPYKALYQKQVQAAQAKAQEKKKASGVKALTELRKEISSLPMTKDAQQVDVSLGKVENALNKGTAAGDLAAVFSFMKILDPGSVVREGEFANAARAAGLSDKIVNALEKVDQGTILTPTQRRDFADTVRQQAQAQFESYQQAISPQRKFAEQQDIDLSMVLPSFSRLGKNKQINIVERVRTMSPEQKRNRIQELLNKKAQE